MLTTTFAGLIAQALLAAAQAPQLRTDPGVYGPALEIVHLYNGQWPTGVAVSSTGRIFSCFPSGLDANNTNNGSNGKFQVAELLNGTEVPYPSVQYNSPPGGAINRTTTPQVTSANYQNYFIGVQSVVVDGLDRLWALDTGRAIDPTTSMLTDNTGGCKLVQINLSNNTIARTITFPPTVCYRDSYFNDVRFSLNPHLSNANSSGVAYITDSSSEGRNGIVVVDLASGNSWRHLNNDARTHAELQFLPFVWGQPVYGFMAGQPQQYLGFGADGIALSADGSELFFAPTGGSYLFSIPTAVLRLQGPNSEVRCQASVTSLTQKGASDGFETDSNGFIYMGNAEQEAVIFYNPANASIATFVRDPRINWIDTLSVANGYLWFTVNQLNVSPQTWPGTDRRVHPYVLFRAKLPGNGTKVSGRV